MLKKISTIGTDFKLWIKRTVYGAAYVSRKNLYGMKREKSTPFADDTNIRNAIHRFIHSFSTPIFKPGPNQAVKINRRNLAQDEVRDFP